MQDLLQIFKALSDKTRLRIICVLFVAKEELCICEIMDALKIAQYNISRHMKELKNAGLVCERREGKFVFYMPAKPLGRLHMLLFRAVEDIDGDIFVADKKRLACRLRLRNGGKCVVGMKGK